MPSRSFPSLGFRSRSKLQTKLDRKATKRSSEQRSQEWVAENYFCTVWRQGAPKHRGFSSADQTSIRFSPLIECLLSFHRDMLNNTTSHPILLPISLHPTTTPHSICLLLLTMSHGTMIIIKPRLSDITRQDHNRQLRRKHVTVPSLLLIQGKGT